MFIVCTVVAMHIYCLRLMMMRMLMMMMVMKIKHNFVCSCKRVPSPICWIHVFETSMTMSKRHSERQDAVDCLDSSCTILPRSFHLDCPVFYCAL